jgi:trk system potassium uptake protein TrkA
VCLVERVVPSGWAGRPLSELDIAGVARVVALTRLGVAIVPQTDTVAQDGDLVHAAVSGDHVETFDEHLADPRSGGH